MSSSSKQASIDAQISGLSVHFLHSTVVALRLVGAGSCIDAMCILGFKACFCFGFMRKRGALSVNAQTGRTLKGSLKLRAFKPVLAYSRLRRPDIKALHG